MLAPTIRTQVIAADDRLPFPGVTISINGKDIGVTNENGEIILMIVNQYDVVSFKHFGFQEKKIFAYQIPQTVVLELDEEETKMSTIENKYKFPWGTLFVGSLLFFGAMSIFSNSNKTVIKTKI